MTNDPVWGEGSDAQEQSGSQAPPIKIGELLVAAQLISQENLDDSMALAMKMHLPLGRIFAMNGYLTEEMLQTGIEICSLIREGKLTVESGVKALELIKFQGLALSDAVGRVSALPSVGGVHASQLGDILRESAAANSAQIETGIIQSLDAAIPLGQALIWTGVITPSLLKSALVGLQLIKEGKATRGQVLQALRGARLRRVHIYQPLKEINAIDKDAEPPESIADLLYLAGLLSEPEYLTAVEVHITEDKTIDEALLSCGLASPASLTATNELQAMINEEALSKEQAIHLLKKLEDVDWEIAQVLGALEDVPSEEEESLEWMDLLEITGVVHPEDMDDAKKKSLARREPVHSILLDGGAITQHTVQCANEIVGAVQQQLINVEQARILLSYCHENNVSVEDGLRRFNWIPVLV
ncbi:MAG TPA: hypothetical protein V6D17_08310 [Candidatus Obscuribacterales bacterium]